MASNLALNARRGDIFYITHNDPNVIVRTIDNPAHPAYDPRVLRPVVPETVKSLKMRGQEVPAEGYKQPGLEDGKQVVIITKGRGRWKAIQVAWEEMLAEGVSKEMFPPFRLIVKKYLNDLDAFEAAVIENVHREEEDAVSKAKKLLKYINWLGDTEDTRERARIVFNYKSHDSMEKDLRLNDANPEVQKIVSEGTISKSAGQEVAALNPKQQAEVQAEIQAEVSKVKAMAPNGAAKKQKPMSVKKTRKIIRKVTGKTEQKEMRSRTEFQDLLDSKEQALANERSSGESFRLKAQIEILRWAFGEELPSLRKAG